MITGGTNLRLVRCPKCWKLLLETGELLVYQCGGCGATLRAKNRKNQGSVNSEVLNDDSAKKSEYDSEKQKLDSSSQREILCSTKACEQVESRDCNDKNSGSGRVTTEIPSSGDLTCHEEERSSSEAGEKEKLSGNTGRTSNSEASSPERKLISGRSSSTSTSERPFNDNIVLQINSSLTNEQLGKSQGAVHNAPDDVRSRCTVVTLEPTDDSVISEDDMIHNKLGDTLEDSSKRQTTRSFRAYDGSVSSCDGLDDQVSDQHSHLPTSSLVEPERAAAFVGARQRQIKGDATKKKKIVTEPEVDHWGRKLSLMSLNEKNGPVGMDRVGCDQNGLLEPTRYKVQAREEVSPPYSEDFHPVKSWLELGRTDSFPKEPFSYAGSGNGGPSNYRHEDYLSNSSLYSSNKLELVERNQMELLKKVDELTDQLNRSYAHSGEATRRVPSRGTQQEKQWPLYYNRKPPDHDMLQQYEVNFPQRPREACRLRSSVPSYPRTASYRDEVSGYQGDWQCLQNLPPHDMCYNEGIHRAYPGHVFYSPYSSAPSSPQRHLQSRYSLRNHDAQTHPHDLIDNYGEMEKFHRRERRQSVKRHCLPIARAAPFIICYNCSKLLQLPADFLVSSKRRHQLQCSSCSKVLVFSLQKRTHLVPYSSDSPVTPPIEALKSATVSTAVSYSGDCGVSTGGSTQGEPASLRPASSNFRSKSLDKRQPNSFSKTMDERRKLSSSQQYRSKQKNSIEAFDSGSSSSNEIRLEKPPSGTEVRLPANGSPLHCLMGYSSPRKLIRGSGF